MRTAVTALAGLPREAQARAAKWLIESLNIPVGSGATGVTAPAATTGAATGARPTQDQPTPKAFMGQKHPSCDTERIACLAYFLTHHRGMQQFSTKDLKALNTEASQPPFSRPATAVGNATGASQFLAAAGGGKKQITVRGEAVVDALPDREAVKKALRDNPMRRRGRRAGKKDQKPAG